MRNLKKYGSVNGIVFCSLILLCILGVYIGMNNFKESYAATGNEAPEYYRFLDRFKSGYKMYYKKEGSSELSHKQDIGYIRLGIEDSTSNILYVYCAFRSKITPDNGEDVKYYRRNFDQFYSSKSISWRTKLANIVSLYTPGDSLNELKLYLRTNYPTEFASGGLNDLTANEVAVAVQTAIWVFTNNDSDYDAETDNTSVNNRINTLHRILLQENGYLADMDESYTPSIDFELNSDLSLDTVTNKYKASIRTDSYDFDEDNDVVELTLYTEDGTLISSNNYTTEYANDGTYTILNITFNDGVFGQSANGNITISSTNEEFDTIYMNVDVAHATTDKTVYVYTADDSTYQNMIGSENTVTTSLSYVNLTAPELEKITVEFDKVDEDNLDGNTLDNAYLQLYRVNGNTSILINEWLTSSDRNQVIDDLLPGKYKIIETLYPEGYYDSNRNVTVDGDDIYVTSGKEFTLTNDYTKFYVHIMNKQTEIKIKKIDSTNNTSLAGASFLIIDHTGAEIYRVDKTTTEDVSVKGKLDKGVYFIVEIEAPTNYVKSDVVYRFFVGDVDINSNVVITGGEYKDKRIVDANFDASTNTITITNDPGLSISKKSIVDDAVYVIGATLVITDSEGNEVEKWVTTNEDHLVTTRLEDGMYTLTETIPGPGYATAESIEFEIRDGKVVNNTDINMKDAPLKVCINKKATNVSGNLAGAKFEMYNEANQLITSFTTTKDTYCVPLSVGIIPGRYTLKETKAPEGYRAASIQEIIVRDTADMQLYEVYNEVEVPITSLNTSNVIYIAIMIMGITGIGLVCYYVKRYNY